MGNPSYGAGHKDGYEQGWRDAANKFDPGGPRISCLVVIGMISTLLGVLILGISMI